jgi:hypothetical protein
LLFSLGRFYWRGNRASRLSAATQLAIAIDDYYRRAHHEAASKFLGHG